MVLMCRKSQLSRFVVDWPALLYCWEQLSMLWMSLLPTTGWEPDFRFRFCYELADMLSLFW